MRHGRTYGLRHWPPRALQPLEECGERKLAHSLMFVLPSSTAPGVSQLLDDEGILPRSRTDEGEGSGGGQHLVGGVDVVLEQDWYAVQWPARPTCPQLVVEGVRDRHRFGIELDHAEEARTVAVERLDPLDVHLGQFPDR